MVMRRLPGLLLVVLAMLSSVFAVAACSGARVQAARFDNAVIYEDEVDAYTEQFRSENSLTGEDEWARYLFEQGLTSATWRERAVRSLAQRALILKRADELGISSDGERVARSVAQAKEDAGVADDDEAAWNAALDRMGMSEAELREKYEYASIEQQVLEADLEEKVASDTALVQEYIDRYFMDTVTRRYSLIYFASDDKAAAETVLKELSGLDGTALAERFAELAEERSADEESAQLGGDVGWDVQYDYNTLDPDGTLVKLAEGQLDDHVIETKDGYVVGMCTDRFEFSKGVSPDSIEPESLRTWVVNAAVTANWAGARSAYLSELVDNAHIQVREAPGTLPYDVDDAVAALSADQ